MNYNKKPVRKLTKTVTSFIKTVRKTGVKSASK